MDDEPAASTPVRWLGILSRDDKLLDRALSMCPEDIPVRKMLIDFYLSLAEYATHHLDENRFLGSTDEVMEVLARARSLISDAPEADAFVYLISEVHYLHTQVIDWIAYSKNPSGSFPEWCATQGRKYSYPVRVYYDR